MTLAAIAGAWVVRLLLRWRVSTGDLRQQLKWLISGGGVCVVGFVISILLNSAHSEPWYAIAQAAPFSIAALPIAIGVGVLKYRLYEIDRLISRTISYLLVTGLLVGVFAGIVLLTTACSRSPHRSASPPRRWPLPPSSTLAPTRPGAARAAGAG